MRDENDSFYFRPVAQNRETACVDAGDQSEASNDEAAKKLLQSPPMKTRAWTRMR